MNKIIEEDIKNIIKSDIDWEKFKNSNVLITGGTGVIGSYLIYTLLKLNEIYPVLNIQIWSIYRNTRNIIKKFNYPEIIPNLFFMQKEYCDFKYLDIDYIIHAASPASSQFYGKNPFAVIECNVFDLKELLELAKEKQSKGLLFFSSGEVTGKVDKEFLTEEDFGYLDPLDIRNCYAESKRMGEQLCKCYFHQYKTPTKIVRPDHTYGPTIDIENDQRVFSEFIQNIINDEDIIMKSDGSPRRTFCYLSDAIEGFFRVLLEGNSGEAYNVSNNNCNTSIKELAETLVNLYIEKNLKIKYEKRENTNNYLENKDTLRPMLSTKKIEKLGYKPKIGIKEGFKRTVESFKEENR